MIDPGIVRLPPSRPGMRIGLLGGSFDPPHVGHVAVSREALKALHLDRVWWLVSPHNPLKPQAPSSDLARRVEEARAMIRDPRILVTGAEAAFGTTYTAETLASLRPILPGVRLVWMMGADNLRQFNRWRDWERIVATTPIAVFNRPGEALPALSSPAAKSMAAWRIPFREAARLALTPPPAWVFLPRPYMPISSTELRRAAQRMAKAKS